MNLDLNEDVKHWGIPDVQQWLAQVSFFSFQWCVLFLVFLFDQPNTSNNAMMVGVAVGDS